MTLKGYVFRNFDIHHYCRYGWIQDKTGYQVLLNPHYYASVEDRGLEFLEEYFSLSLDE